MKKFLLLTFFLYGAIFSFTVFAADAPGRVTIDTSLPGPYQVSGSGGLGPVAAIGNIYYFAMALGGFLAFASIVYAGIKWTASRGNTSTISDAKDQITQALIGLLLLVGSFIVLNTINPQLTILKFPQLTKIEVASSTPGEPSAEEYSCHSGSTGGDTCYPSDPTCGNECASGETCKVDAECTAPSSAGSCDQSNWPELAGTNNEVYPRKNAPELINLMGCIGGKVSVSGSVYTYDQSHDVCNYNRGQRTCGSCSHAVNSCHYGGHSGSAGSLAVDYGISSAGSNKAAVGNAIVQAAIECGVPSAKARCESNAGSRVDCGSATHVHVSAASCDAN